MIRFSDLSGWLQFIVVASWVQFIFFIIGVISLFYGY